MKIAIIDDGINRNMFESGDIEDSIEVTEKLQIKKRNKNDDGPTGYSHGTICAKIIKKNAKAALLVDVKILNSRKRKASKKQLINALYWCLENHINIVHLSIGSTNLNDFTDIKNCINDVVEKGLIIIAAGSNNNKYTVPAGLTNVIGVSCNQDIKESDYHFIKNPLLGIDIFTNGRHYINSSIGYCTPSNSYAAPYITAKVFCMMREQPHLNLEGVKKLLYSSSLNFIEDSYDPYQCINYDWSNTVGTVYDYESNSRKYWDSRLHKITLTNMLAKSTFPLESDSPIIMVKDPQLGLLTEIARKFTKEHYSSLCISTNINCLPSGYEFLPADISTENFMGYVQAKYVYDLVLFNEHNSSEAVNKSFLYDVEITVDENLKGVEGPVIVESDHHLFHKFRIAAYPVKRDIDKLYKKIKRIIMN